MTEIVILMMKSIRQVPTMVKEVQWLSILHYLPVLANISDQLETDVNQQSIDVLCILETIESNVHPQRRRMNAEWQSLPNCEDRTPSTTTTFENQIVELANSLIHMLQSLQVALCVAETRL